MGAVGGGLDVRAIVENMMIYESKKLEKLEKAEKKTQDQMTNYTQLQNLVTAFQSSLTDLSNSFTSIAYSTTSTNTNVLTASITTNTDVAPAIHTLDISTLAQAGSVDSTNHFSSRTNPLSITGTLTFTIGASNFSINVASTDSLNNIRDNINAAANLNDIGVTASVLASTSGGGADQYDLVVSSNNTGTANAVTISGTAAASFNNFSNVITAAQDATFTIDSANVTRSTNTISDVLDGVTLDLLNSGSATLNINQNYQALTAGVTTAVQNSIAAYNAIISFVDKENAQDHTVDSTFTFVKDALQNVMQHTFSGVGMFTSISDLGITLADPQALTTSNGAMYTTSGQLQLMPDPNSALPQFSQQLAVNFADVQSLLTNTVSGAIPLLNNALTALLQSGETDLNIGTIAAGTRVITDRLSDLNEAIYNEEERLTGVRARLTRKYSKLSSLLRQFDDTREYLAKQLDHMDYAGRA